MRIISQNEANMLFVAAAGNKNTPLDDGQWLPASLGGPSRANVITVASVDANGSLSKFSNRGRNRVDVAAPGCHIHSWIDGSNQTVAVSGTSQSAGLASFAVGLLRVVKPKNLAREIKNRLIISGDLLVDESSRKAVFSESSINIAKSLYFDLDYLVVQKPGESDRVYLGAMTTFSGVTCGGSVKNYGRLRALKRIDSQRVVVFAGEMKGEISVCEGEISEKFGEYVNNLKFMPRLEKVGDDLISLDMSQEILSFSAGELKEFIRKDP